MSRTPAPFSPKGVLAVVVVGMGAFLLFLYAIGAGWTGRDETAGSGHAASNGLNGYAALVELLEQRGMDVSLSRTGARLEEEALLILTPPAQMDPEDLEVLLEQRRWNGPTLLILPKWLAIPASQAQNAPTGWVNLTSGPAPTWLGEIALLEDARLRRAPGARWRGLDRSGRLPDPYTQSIAGTALARLVADERGRTLVAYLDDEGSYPTLAPLAGREARELGDDDDNPWALVIVAEPDLFNNQGLADRSRAAMALALIEASTEGQDLPVVFDLTLPGLGRSQNLLTLAFEPPFLAATLCLLLAAVLVGWRAFRRFGPPVAETPELALGKRQLAANGGALVERTRRIHLLGAPYAALVATRIARRLGVRESQPEARDRQAAELLSARGAASDYPAHLAALREARHTAELLRAAHALNAIERTLTP
ncbi:MAG: hypothetical protein B7Z08_03140 [Sphingomonadales bacterium 32-68-7]|nr:MAG: hypothetical protein B7Z33_07810 [Sphingomonadales bacterium 12-68-11]OYX09933.1 MAG: hypothetical protein B7Z08_03140 [Sphingomonadales bacterium 32-68-7]